MTKILIDRAVVEQAASALAARCAFGDADLLRAALAQTEQPAQCFTDWWQTTDGSPSYQDAFEAGRNAQPAKREPLTDEQISACLSRARGKFGTLTPTDIAREVEAEITKGRT